MNRRTKRIESLERLSSCNKPKKGRGVFLFFLKVWANPRRRLPERVCTF